jgi:hypothetical protein
MKPEGSLLCQRSLPIEPHCMSVCILTLCLSKIYFTTVMYMSRDSSVGIAIRLQVGLPGFVSRQRQDLSLLHSVQIGYGAHPASYPIGTRESFRVVKRSEREALISIYYRGHEWWSYTSTPPYVL